MCLLLTPQSHIFIIYSSNSNSVFTKLIWWLSPMAVLIFRETNFIRITNTRLEKHFTVFSSTSARLRLFRNHVTSTNCHCAVCVLNGRWTSMRCSLLCLFYFWTFQKYTRRTLEYRRLIFSKLGQYWLNEGYRILAVVHFPTSRIASIVLWRWSLSPFHWTTGLCATNNLLRLKKSKGAFHYITDLELRGAGCGASDAFSIDQSVLHLRPPRDKTRWDSGRLSLAHALPLRVVSITLPHCRWPVRETRWLQSLPLAASRPSPAAPRHSPLATRHSTLARQSTDLIPVTPFCVWIWNYGVPFVVIYHKAHNWSLLWSRNQDMNSHIIFKYDLYSACFLCIAHGQSSAYYQ